MYKTTTMVSYNPDKIGSSPDPDEVAEQLANQLELHNQLSERVRERIRTSEKPLAEPIGDPITSTGSLRSLIRYCVLNKVEDTEEVIHLSTSKAYEEKHAGITTHPSLLDQPNRLLPQLALAKAYPYGYWPNEWATVQGGTLPESVDSVAGVPFEQRRLGLTWKDEYYQSDYESNNNWFADEEAVSEFAARVTADDVSWAQYIPLYQTTAVPTYRINQVAETMDWSEFPDHPDARPSVEDRFDSSTNPTVGDFIRMAILRKIERDLPTITNLSTGPEPWGTDRISLVIDPSEADGRPYRAILCSSVVLKKLAEYGYRPVDGWYAGPAVGYNADDPILPRWIEFARGHALREWCDKMQMNSPLFDDATIVREAGLFPEIDWETFIPSLRSQILTYHQLHDLAQNPETLF